MCMFFLLFFYNVVQASLFLISVCFFFLGGGGGCVCVCGIFELLVQRVVWHPVHVFCMDETFGLSSALQLFSSSFPHFSCGNDFHGTKDCSQANILNLVHYVGVCLGCCHPGPIFHRWSDHPCVDSF